MDLNPIPDIYHGKTAKLTKLQLTHLQNRRKTYHHIGCKRINPGNKPLWLVQGQI